MSVEETIFAVEDTVDQFVLHFSIINRVYIIHTTFKIRCVQSKGDARKETLTRIACVVKETETIKVGLFYKLQCLCQGKYTQHENVGFSLQKQLKKLTPGNVAYIGKKDGERN